MRSSSNGNDSHSQQMLAENWEKMSVLDLWHKQVSLHHHETYKGIGIAKFPQDLWNYEKLIDSSKPKAILEIGINNGGFTRWLYDRLLLSTTAATDVERIVIGLDIDIKNAYQNLSGVLTDRANGVRIELIECDLLDEQSVQKSKEMIIDLVGDMSMLIVEDSGHTYETTRAALEAFSGLLKPGEWFVVEDTCVDIEALRESVEWPRGALNAVNGFLNDNPDFERSTFNSTYTITCHPFGFLRKKLASAPF